MSFLAASGPLPYVCKWPGCGKAFARSDDGGLKRHVETVHDHADLRKLSPVLVYRNNAVFIYLVKHGKTGAGTC